MLLLRDPQRQHTCTSLSADKEDILACCADGYKLGFRTFVLQGGEDPWYTTDRLSDLVHTIRTMYPDCAITLSTGEATKAEYQQLFDAGADRFLLRHETHNADHYQQLHPPRLLASHRQQCLWDLKEIGYQVGTGFMVGSPGQTSKHLAEDLLFLKELNPQMVGIGPFIPHHDTPFAAQKAGTLELTLFLLGLIRLMLPKYCSRQPLPLEPLPQRTGTWYFIRGQRGHAKPLPKTGTRRLSAL